MKILGIYDRHNCSVALVEDGKITFAIEEERLSRIKYHDGTVADPPYLSIKEALKHTKPHEIDKIVIGFLPPAQLMKKVYKTLREEKNLRWYFWYLKYWGLLGPLEYISPYFYNLWRFRRIKKALKRFGLAKTPIELIDHHRAHAASAYYMSGRKNSLICTLDGKGDALCGSIYVGDNWRLKKIKEISKYHSIGYLYSAITVGLGFKQMRHEGKITGLSAYGDKNGHVYQTMKRMIGINGLNFDFKFNRKLYHPPYPNWCKCKHLFKKIAKCMPNKTSPKDYAAAVQRITEELVSLWVANAANHTKVRDVVVAGGVFANVRVNQEVIEKEAVHDIFVCPPMGDSGISAGGAMYVYVKEMLRKGLEPNFKPIDNVYYGPGYTTEEIKDALDKSGLVHVHHKNVEKEIAKLLAKSHVVARFNGRMEFGPRALGNRSILYQTSDQTINEWLNKRLKRTEFMPFAPSTLFEDRHKYYLNVDAALSPAQFMTITFDCTNFMKKNCPAVVHIDGTARPQLVRKEVNPSYHKIISEYKKLTGIATIINTSFNMHEEPIVCTPQDAIRSFQAGHLDYLAIGNFLVKNPKEMKR